MKPNSQIKTTDCPSVVDAFLKTFNEVLAAINTSCPKLSHRKKKTRTIKADVN